MTAPDATGTSQPEEPTNLLDYKRGMDAGWRGDQLVTEKSPSYMMGYEIGQTQRAQHECGCLGLSHRNGCPKWILPL